MFGIGMPELIIILVIALLVIGPSKLPDLAKSLGKGLAEFKKASEDFQRNIQEEARKSEEKDTDHQQVASPDKPHVETPVASQSTAAFEEVKPGAEKKEADNA